MTVSQLQTQINTYITTNGDEAITGSILNTILQNITLFLSDTPDTPDTFSADIPVLLAPGNTFGKYVNGDTVTANGLTAIDVILSALTQQVHPTYIQPTVSITATPSTTQRYEVGTSIDAGINGSFTPHDAGGLSGYVVNYNGSQIGTSLPCPYSIVISLTQSVFQLVATYAAGPVKNDNMGNPDSYGSIGAGSVSSSIAYTGAYYTFYGPAASIPAVSNDVRNLSDAAFLFGSDGGFNPVLNTGTTYFNFIVAVPSQYEIDSVIDEDAFDIDITSYYVYQTTIMVSDGGSGLVSYDVYAMVQSVPYSSNHRHSITIS
jgi:hypothetical protein